MSIINRHNYEEFFLLYTDDELNATERRAVEEFVQQHPDLKVELEMLQESVLPVDPVVFHAKDLLLRKSSSMINESNYEEYFVLYTDDELNNEQKDCVEQFVYRNPQHQDEFELLQRVRMQADRHLVFPDKTGLYRSEKEVEKLFVLSWWKIVAAAIVFIFLSGLGWYIVSSEKTNPVFVKNSPEKNVDRPVVQKSQQKQENIVQADPVIPKINNAETKKSPTKQQQSAISVSHEDEKAMQQMLTDNKNEEKNTKGRNIQSATRVSLVRPEINIQEMGTSTSMALQDQKKITEEATGPTEENKYAYQAATDEIEILNTTISKKNKLRGIFRKVSRVVEKTTNIEPGDGRGIRIANFEIALN